MKSPKSSHLDDHYTASLLVAKMGSFVQVPNDSPFSLDNIPFGVFSTKDDPTPRCATAIGDFVLDLRALSKSGFFQDASVADALSQVCGAFSQMSSYGHVEAWAMIFE